MIPRLPTNAELWAMMDEGDIRALVAGLETLRRGRARSNFHETAEFIAEGDADEPQPPEEPPDDDDRMSADELADWIDAVYERGREEGWKVSKKGGAK